MIDTCKDCEKRPIFALKRHQRAEQAWHQQISAQLASLNFTLTTSPLAACKVSPLWMAVTLQLLYSPLTLRVSECQEDSLSPPRGPWRSIWTKAWPAVDIHGPSCGRPARPPLCLPWNWKLQGLFLTTNHCLCVCSSFRRNYFLMRLKSWPHHHLSPFNFNQEKTNMECGLKVGLTKCFIDAHHFPCFPI